MHFSIVEVFSPDLIWWNVVENLTIWYSQAIENEMKRGLHNCVCQVTCNKFAFCLINI